MKRPRSLRLDALLVERGLFADANEAARWIMAGKVRVADRYESKSGTRVPIDAAVDVRGLDQRYASRGGLKLEGALERFGIDVAGSHVLDAGASTGGFTDCLLQRGAARVYAVDAGFGQLRGKLSGDARVVNLERTNISDLDPDRFDPPLDLATVDLSYLSLRVAVPVLAALFRGPPQLVCLVKPLFEGVPDAEKAALDRFPAVFAGLAQAWSESGLELHDLVVSPLLGRNETVEFFARVGPVTGSEALESLTRRALGEAAERLGAPDGQTERR